MAIHSSILAWEILWTEEPGRLQSMGSQRVRHNLATNSNIDKSHIYPQMITTGLEDSGFALKEKDLNQVNILNN